MEPLIRSRQENTFRDPDGIDAGPIFPILSADMMHRAAAYGQQIRVDGGDFLYRFGERDVDTYFVIDGEIDVLESDGHGGHVLVTTHRRNQFTGEISQLSGRGVLLCARAARPSTVVRVPHDRFRQLVSAEADLGKVILRAYILRRAERARNSNGATIIVGPGHAPDSLRIQSFLDRNGYPYRMIDTTGEPDALTELAPFRVSSDTLPVVILNGETVLMRPDNRDLAKALGISETLDAEHVFDVAIIGAGPAGLSSAVYAASEGLDTVVIDGIGPGGQAGSSSLVENYLGFPTGISGQALAERAQVQAQKFGARFVIASAATRIECQKTPFRIELEGGREILARSVILACGAKYRRLDLPELARFEGRGVHYAATALEGRLCSASEVAVVGGGNSAGQAAIFLSGIASHVHMIIRRDDLRSTMSDYLIRRIRDSPRITVHSRCEVSALMGEDRLATVRWRTSAGQEQGRDIPNLFLMVGADPNTGWLEDCVALDPKGFVLTGHVHDAVPGVAQFSSSVPGIFAVGDVRADSLKRVAAAVGGGSVVVHAVHRWLAGTGERV